MNVITLYEPARTKHICEHYFTLVPPANVRVQTTGPGAEIHMDHGPAPGKSWKVKVLVECSETDEG